MAEDLLKKFTVDVDSINNNAFKKTPAFSQGDVKTAILIINLTEEGTALDLTNKKVKASFKKPDGQSVFQDETTGITKLDALAGKIQIELRTQVLSVSGTVRGQVSISDDAAGLVAETTDFTFLVRESIVNTSIISTNDLPFVEQAVEAAAVLGEIDLQTIVNNTTNVNNIKLEVETARGGKAQLTDRFAAVETSLAEISPLKPSGDTTGAKDTTAIQNAINTNGKAVLSAGNFYITSLSLNGTQAIIGTSVNQTIINTVATSGYGISILPTAQKCELRYFNLTSTYTGCGGISFNDISVSPSYDTRHFMDNVRISNMAGTSLYIGQYTRENRFFNIHTNGSHGYCIFTNGTDSFFNNCTANSAYKNGFYFGPTSANNNAVNCKTFLCGGSTDNTLTEPFRAGFYVSGSGLNVLTGCESQQNYGDGYYVDSPFNSINGVLVDGNGYMGTYTSNGITVTSAGNTIVATIQNPPLQGALTNFVYLSSSAVRNSLLITANENTAQQLAYMGTTGYTTVSSNIYGEESANPGNYVVINGEQYGNYPMSDLFATYNSTKSLNNFGGTDTATYNSPTNEYTFSLTSATTIDARVQFTIPQGTGTGDLSQYKYLYMTATVKCGDVNRFFYPSLQCYAQVNSGSWIYLNAVSYSGLKNSISTNYMKVIAVFDLTHIATQPYTWNNLFPSIAAVKRTAITDGQTHNVFIKDAKFYLSK